MQDGGSSSGQGCAVCCQAVDQAKDQRERGDFGFSREQDFLDQFQAGVPALGFARVIETRRLDEICDGLGAVVVFRRPDGEPGVAVEGHFSTWEVAGEAIK